MSTWAIFWSGLFGCSAINTLANMAWRFWRANQRTRRIAAHGWPPAHLDADGDAIEAEAP